MTNWFKQIDLRFMVWFKIHLIQFPSFACICSNLWHFCTPLYLHAGQKILDAHNDVLKKKHHFWHHFTVRFEPWPQYRYHQTSDLWIVLGPGIPATPTVLGWWMLLPNKGFKWKWMIWLFPKMPEKWWFIGMYYTIDDNSDIIIPYNSMVIGVLGWRNNIPKMNSGNILTLD